MDITARLADNSGVDPAMFARAQYAKGRKRLAHWMSEADKRGLFDLWSEYLWLFDMLWKHGEEECR